MLAADLLVYGKHSSERSTAAVTAADKHCPAHEFHLNGLPAPGISHSPRDTGGMGMVHKQLACTSKYTNTRPFHLRCTLYPFTFVTVKWRKGLYLLRICEMETTSADWDDRDARGGKREEGKDREVGGRKGKKLNETVIKGMRRKIKVGREKGWVIEKRTD